jgi:hypothetical protein
MGVTDMKMPEEYNTSPDEMNRRKRAFGTLVIGLFLGACLLSLALFSSSLQMVLPGMAVFAGVLILADLLFRRVFDASGRTVVVLTGDSLERIGMKRHDSCGIDDITKITIKRNVKNKIREMRIDVSGAGPVYINGLERFEEFRDRLLRAVTRDIPIGNVIERIDYDHPLFYVIFGGMTGAVTVGTMKLLLQVQEGSIKYIQAAIACLVIIAGIFVLINRPIAGRYGGMTGYADLCMGLLMVLSGIGLACCSGIFNG